MRSDTHNAWVITQLVDNGKYIYLNDVLAPHGRSRQSAIFKDETKTRQSKIYYPGNDEPTTVIFGIKKEDLVLKGRLSRKMTHSRLFDDIFTPNAMKEYIKTMVADKLPISVIWKDVLNIEGTFESASFEQESYDEIVYTLTIRVDHDLLLATSKFRAIANFASNGDLNDTIASLQDDINNAFVKAKQPSSMKVSIFDAMSRLTSTLTAPISSITNSANQISNASNQTYANVRTLRASIHQLKTISNSFRTTYDNLSADQALQTNLANEDLKYYKSKYSDNGITSLMRNIIIADKISREMERKSIRGGITAKEGDTWEKLAERAGIGSSRANDIKMINDGASLPKAGIIYMIPV